MSFKSVKLDHIVQVRKTMLKLLKLSEMLPGSAVTMPPIFPTLASAARCAVYYSGYCCTTTGQ